MNEIKTKTEWLSRKKMSDVLFVLWAGGAALLSYSLVYALCKPFTAATFDGLDFFGMDAYWDYPKDTSEPLMWAEGIRR